MGPRCSGMAGPRVNKKKEAAAAVAAASEPAKPEGPVLTVISKRLRAFRKKLNEITDLEEKQREGKELIDQQLEKLKNKATVNITIDELEKVTALLADAVKEEVALARQQALDEAEVVTKKETERADAAEAAVAEAQAAAKAAQEGEAAAKEKAETAKKAAEEAAAARKPADVDKVVQLLYFTWVSSSCLHVHAAVGQLRLPALSTAAYARSWHTCICCRRCRAIIWCRGCGLLAAVQLLVRVSLHKAAAPCKARARVAANSFSGRHQTDTLRCSCCPLPAPAVRLQPSGAPGAERLHVLQGAQPGRWQQGQVGQQLLQNASHGWHMLGHTAVEAGNPCSALPPPAVGLLQQTAATARGAASWQESIMQQDISVVHGASTVNPSRCTQRSAAAGMEGVCCRQARPPLTRRPCLLLLLQVVDQPQLHKLLDAGSSLVSRADQVVSHKDALANCCKLARALLAGDKSTMLARMSGGDWGGGRAWQGSQEGDGLQDWQGC